MYLMIFLNLGYTWYILSKSQRYLETKNLISGYTRYIGIYHVCVKTVFVNIDIPRLSLIYNLVLRISIS